MHLAIVIVSYNTRELLRRCLETVFASLHGSPQLEAGVWVVDNASSDGSADAVAQAFPAVHLVRSTENLGFAGGNNLALRLLGFQPAGDELVRTGQLPLPDDASLSPHQPPRYVTLLNSDTEVAGDALARVAAFLEGKPDAGAGGPQLVYPNGSFQAGAFRFPGLAQTALDLFPPPGRLGASVLDSRINGRYPRRLMTGAPPFTVDFVLGAALTVRGEAIRQIGLLDESYFMYCEEMDWQQRLARAGWRVYCLPAARIVHHGSASASQFRAAMLVELWRSRLRYFSHYHGRAFNRSARALIRRGMQAEARRARREHPADLEQRLDAFAAITELTRSAP